MQADAAMLLGAMEGVSYVVDPNGVILGVGSANWDRFATENRSGHLRAETVIGRKLRDFISGQDVQLHYDRLVKMLVHKEHDAISFGCRCDAPDVRRDMRLCMSAIRDGSGETRGILYQSLLVSETDRPRVSLFDAEKIARSGLIPADAVIVTVCSQCHQTMMPDGNTWVDPVDYYRRGGADDVWVSHGICPGCSDLVVQKYLQAISR